METVQSRPIPNRWLSKPLEQDFPTPRKNQNIPLDDNLLIDGTPKAIAMGVVDGSVFSELFATPVPCGPGRAAPICWSATHSTRRSSHRLTRSDGCCCKHVAWNRFLTTTPFR